jgi:hypothetical protein
MKPFKGSVSQKTTCRKEYKIVTNDRMSEPYWDEGIIYHRSRGRRKNKEILKWKYGEYRTWKYNRKKQWK